MIKLRHQQPTVWEGLFAEEVAELWEPWRRAVDELFEDEELLDAVYDAQGRHLSRRLCLTRCSSLPGIQQSRVGCVGNLKKVFELQRPVRAVEWCANAG